MGNQVPCDTIFQNSETKPPCGFKTSHDNDNKTLNYKFTLVFIFLQSHIHFFLCQ